MSVKLPAIFDQNSPHTFGKIVKKLITTKTLSKFDLDLKCQGHGRNQKLMTWETKTSHPKKIKQVNYVDPPPPPPPGGGGRHNYTKEVMALYF